MKRAFRILSVFIVLIILTNVKMVSYGAYRDEYPDIYDVYWNNNTARWSVDGYASKYELRLYRDDYLITVKSLTSRSISLGSYMTRRSGDYYFEVRAYNSYYGWTNWVTSDYRCIDSRCYDDCYWHDDRRWCDDRYYRYDDRRYSRDVSYAVNQGPPYSASSGNTTNYPVESSVPNLQVGSSNQTPAPQVLYVNASAPQGNFVVDGGSWYFRYTTGINATNTWIQVLGKWYFFDMSGKMLTGLQNINNKTYFFNNDGSMYVGVLTLNGMSHFFDASGAMLY